jgi:hypothetical protein
MVETEPLDYIPLNGNPLEGEESLEGAGQDDGPDRAKSKKDSSF